MVALNETLIYNPLCHLSWEVLPSCQKFALHFCQNSGGWSSRRYIVDRQLKNLNLRLYKKSNLVNDLHNCLHKYENAFSGTLLSQATASLLLQLSGKGDTTSTLHRD